MSDEILPPIQPEEAHEASQEQKPPDDLSDLRASMAEEEKDRLKSKKSGLLKKVTGLLHRQTGRLEESQPAPAKSEPSGPFTAPLRSDEDLSNEIFEQQIGRSFSGWDEEEPAAQEVVPETPELAETRPLIWDEDEEAAEWAQAAAAQSAFPAEDIADVEAQAIATPAFDESILEMPPDAQAEAAPKAPGGAFVSEEEGEGWEAGAEETPASSQTESLRAELMPDAAAESAPAEPPRKKTTRSLRQIVTGWLDPDAVTEPVHEEVADDLIADRLQRVQSSEYPPEIPGSRKAADYLSTPVDENRPAEVEEDDSGEAALWKPRVERERAQPEGRPEDRPAVRPVDQPAWESGSRLPRDWVDEHAAYPAQEPVAAEYGAAPEEEPLQKAPSRLSEVVQQAGDEAVPAITDVRSQALEDYVEPEYVAVEMQTPREPFPQRALAWARKNFALLLALVIIVALAGVLAATRPWTRAPLAQPNTPVPSELPYPVGLELTGGWFFDVDRSTMINGVWQPQGAEWLDNSQMRRVVAIPWNEQTEAVIQTLERGDQINLIFSNNDLMAFLVRSVERLDKTDTSLMTENKPGLVIILYNEDSDQRWVVLALPK